MRLELCQKRFIQSAKGWIVNELLTIGYEGTTIEDFVPALKLAGVQVLIDIRDVPVSRKRGFSKTALARSMEEAGIEYVHLRDLGDPKPGREAARRGDMQTFERVFRSHMETDRARAALRHAIRIASDSRACLLCFERDHCGCHRTIVAEKMAMKVRHLEICSLAPNPTTAKAMQEIEAGKGERFETLEDLFSCLASE